MKPQSKEAVPKTEAENKPAAPEIIYFFDNSALMALGQGEIDKLLGACKEGHLKIAICEATLWEWSRNLFQGWTEKLRITPRLEEEAKKDYLHEILGMYALYFREHGVLLIEHTAKIEAASLEIMRSEATYFSENNPNDARDAIIFCTVKASPGNVRVVTNDTNLSMLLEKDGFKVEKIEEKREKEFIPKLLNGKKIKAASFGEFKKLNSAKGFVISEDLAQAIRRTDPNYSHLLAANDLNKPLSAGELKELNDFTAQIEKVDTATKEKIMGFSRIFFPMSKDSMPSLIKGERITAELIDSNARRLCELNVIEDTGKNYIPKNHKLCELAARKVLPTVLEMLKEEDEANG